MYRYIGRARERDISMHVRTIQCMSDRNNNSIQHKVENLHRHSNTNEFLLSINVSLWASQTHIE